VEELPAEEGTAGICYHAAASEAACAVVRSLVQELAREL
jgi:hypothetical protein